MITDTCEIWAYFAPQISETAFEGILATVNGRKLISNIFGKRIEKLRKKYDVKKENRHLYVTFISKYLD